MRINSHHLRFYALNISHSLSTTFSFEEAHLSFTTTEGRNYTEGSLPRSISAAVSYVWKIWHHGPTLKLLSSWITVSIVGLWSGSSWVHTSPSFASAAASGSENCPCRLVSTNSSYLHDSAASRIKVLSCNFPDITWRTMTPNAYTSLFSVKRPVVIYSGARYPIAALVFRVEKTMSSASSLGRPESEINGLNCWLMRTFSTDMFWWIMAGLFSPWLCKYPIPGCKRTNITVSTDWLKCSGCLHRQRSFNSLN